ncbi:unnamed protein product [Rotaria sp. Silwood1]|nr:unnamed protein product [Rotaria sp. Silwood1]
MIAIFDVTDGSSHENFMLLKVRIRSRTVSDRLVTVNYRDITDSCDSEKGLCSFQNLKFDFNWKQTYFYVELYNAPPYDQTTNIIQDDSNTISSR